jgi:hypothetical protein
MIRRLFAAATFALLATASVMAQVTPASNPEDCLKAAFDLAQAAEGKNLPNDDLDKVEQLLNKMEGHCDARQFTEAAAVATDLKTMISKQ